MLTISQRELSGLKTSQGTKYRQLQTFPHLSFYFSRTTVLPNQMSNILFQMFSLIFGCLRWEGNMVAVTPSWPKTEVSDVFFKNLFVFSRILGGHPHMRRLEQEHKKPTYM
jgi:hypothetical protein